MTNKLKEKIIDILKLLLLTSVITVLWVIAGILASVF